MSELTGLYVHIPFCSVKCFYCDFAAFSGQKKTTARYLAALEKEAALMPARRPQTLYIGGGTPSELSATEIEELFQLLARAYPDAQWHEVTFEANPDSLTVEKIAVLRRAGVTRLSLGLQTADDQLLKAIGRRHTFSDFVSVYETVHAQAGIAVSVDLMYGLPGQTLASLTDSLDRVLALKPEHLSLYGLQVEDRTVFARRGVESDEDLGRQMFEAALERLGRAGFHHYEISNFAQSGHESLHNQIYWVGGEYVGLGCGAASYLDGERATNTDKLIEYCSGVEAGRRPIAEIERPQGRDKIGEEAFLGLRLVDGFEMSTTLETSFSREWSELARRGLVARAGRHARLTREGIFLANDAFTQFVPPFAEV